MKRLPVNTPTRTGPVHVSVISASDAGRRVRTGARIGTDSRRQYPWYVRLIFALQRRKYGQELEPARLWGRIPRAYLWLTLLYRSLDRASSPIEPALRSLIQVRIAQIDWCAFCTDLNSAAAIDRHVPQAKLEALPEHAVSPLFSDRERAALAYAEAIADSRRGVDDQLFEQVRKHFDEDSVIELTAIITFQDLSAKFNAALSVPAQGFCAPRVGKEP